MQLLPDVHVTEIISAPIEKVWAYLRDFNGLTKFHPNIKRSIIEQGNPEEVGCIRHLTFDAGYVREELLMLDDNTFTMEYGITQSSLPLTNYVASIQLRPNPNEDKTICEWSASFSVRDGADKNELINLVSKDVFKAGFLALANKLLTQTSLSYH